MEKDRKCPRCEKKGIETDMIGLPVNLNHKLKDCWWCPECNFRIQLQKTL